MEHLTTHSDLHDLSLAAEGMPERTSHEVGECVSGALGTLFLKRFESFD